jgi:hypothetical protein
MAFVFIIKATMSLKRRLFSLNLAINIYETHPYSPRTSAKIRMRTIDTNTFDS